MEKKDAYRIPAENLEELQARIAKLNKRAAKLGCRPIGLLVGEAERETVKVLERDELGGVVRDPETGNPVHRDEVRVYHRVTVDGEAPKYAGWTLVAAMEYLAADGENEAAMFLRAVPGQQVPESYRRADQKCDHCGLVRRRSETFVVRHDDGVHKQVGRQCIADFLGHQDPNRFAAMAEFVVSAGDICGDAEEEGWGRGGGSRRTVWLPDYLSHVAVVVRNHGWLSRSKARELSESGRGGWATADRALHNMFPPVRMSRREREEILEPADEDKAFAAKALEWAREDLRLRKDLNDYQHNLAVICSRDVVPDKGVGVAASLIAAYRRETGLEAERKARADREAKSEWFGTPGKREVFTLTVLKVIDCESEFGTTHLHKFVDPRGNVAMWFASSESLEIGKTYRIRGTVKGHDDYKGVKQTQLTRCAVEGEWFCPGCRRANTPDAENPADVCTCGVRRGSWTCPNCRKVAGPDVKACGCGHDLKSWRCNKCCAYNLKKAKTCENVLQGPEAGPCGAEKNAWKCHDWQCAKWNGPKTEICACGRDKRGHRVA